MNVNLLPFYLVLIALFPTLCMGEEYEFFPDLTDSVARYDYAVRAYYAAIPRFDRPDALAAKYPHISPYAFCANNPVMHIDPCGCNPIYSLEGKFLGTDDEALQGYIT